LGLYLNRERKSTNAESEIQKAPSNFDKKRTK